MSTFALAALALQIVVQDAPAARHEACLDMIARDAQVAHEEALAWRYQGGGWPAEHCVSLALIALGHAEPGATRLRAAAEGAVSASDLSRAIMFGQAGDGFLEAEAPAKALAAFERGASLAPDDAGLQRGIAEAALALEQNELALTAADAAVAGAVEPEDQLKALRLRAEARFASAAYQDAMDDVAAARVLAPDDIDLLLLRGRINEAVRQHSN